MSQFRKIGILMLVLMLGFTMVLSGCTQNPEKVEDGGNTGEEAKGKVKLAMVNWAEGIAMTNLAQAVLEDKMGYEVESTMAEPGLIFTSVANGDYDAFLDAWLPVTHESYMEQFGEDVEDLGVNFEGAKVGLVVPSYVDINSIEEMNSVADQFDGRIIGIGSGAGIMSATEDAIDQYGLDYELVEGSGPVMTASLADAIDSEEAIVVTGWAPHWKFARYDLKFLEDPKGIYGEAEDIRTIARKGLEEENPELAQFLRNFKLNDQQLGSLMGQIADSDEDALEVARKWMQENEELVNGWLPNK